MYLGSFRVLFIELGLYETGAPKKTGQHLMRRILPVGFWKMVFMRLLVASINKLTRRESRPWYVTAFLSFTKLILAYYDYTRTRKMLKKRDWLSVSLFPHSSIPSREAPASTPNSLKLWLTTSALHIQGRSILRQWKHATFWSIIRWMFQPTTSIIHSYYDIQTSS